jgi:hypothetical protein
MDRCNECGEINSKYLSPYFAGWLRLSHFIDFLKSEEMIEMATAQEMYEALGLIKGPVMDAEEEHEKRQKEEFGEE